jgi:phytoene desaturase
LKAVIVGSGIAGISTAIRFANRGFQVSVFEANDYPGGKLTSFTQDGFRFDAGPSLFTLPVLVDELFEQSGKDPRDFFNYQTVDTTCHYFFEDGTLIRAFADKTLLKREIDEKLSGCGNNVIRYLRKSADIYNLTENIFLKKSLHKFRNYLSKDVVKALIRIYSLNMLSTMNRVNEQTLKNDKLVQIFNRYATYNGSSPYLAPGILSLIPHLEFNLGTYFPKGGMHDITMSLFRLAETLGVEFNFNSRVNRINYEKGKIKSVDVNGTIFPADIVVSNMDIVPTYKNLLPDLPEPRQVIEQERSSSALIYYWGIKKEFPRLDLHNIFFSEDYRTEFEYIFKRLELYHDPTVYVHISSKYNKQDAPKGMENWFVMINVPCNTGQNWDDYIQQARQKIINKLSRILEIDISTLILNESYLEPRSIESKTSSYRGSLYGASSNKLLSAFVRHPNFHSKLNGLYFCGGSVHPGGGIPLSILSGKIVDDLVENDYDL